MSTHENISSTSQNANIAPSAMPEKKTPHEHRPKPVSDHHTHRHLHHHPPHEFGHPHPRMRGRVIVDYESAYESIEEIFGENAPALIAVMERSPLEVEVSLCIALGLNADFSGLPQMEGRTVVRHQSPFIGEQSLEILANSLPGEHSSDELMRVYGDVPDEQIALALAIAFLSNKVRRSAQPPNQEGGQ